MSRRATKMQPKRQQVEMLDGRVFFSHDNWETVWQARGDKNGRSHRKILDKEEADMVRFIAICQASAGP